MAAFAGPMVRIRLPPGRSLVRTRFRRRRALARERANEDGCATTRPHRYGGIFLGWLANAASHPGSCRRCAACSYPPWPSMGRTRFRGRDRRANGRRTCTAERQCNSPSRGFLSIRPPTVASRLHYLDLIHRPLSTGQYQASYIPAPRAARAGESVRRQLDIGAAAHAVTGEI